MAGSRVFWRTSWFDLLSFDWAFELVLRFQFIISGHHSLGGVRGLYRYRVLP